MYDRKEGYSYKKPAKAAEKIALRHIETPTHQISCGESWCKYQLYPILVDEAIFRQIPTESDRHTCLCKLHENQRLMVSKLASLNVIDHSDVRALTESVCCDSSSFTCMHQQCDECKHSRIKRNDGVNINTDTTWLQWKTIKETRRIKEEDKQVSVTKKVEMAGTIYDLVEQCESMLERYKTHVFNINHQYQFYRSLLLKMQQTECLIHVDFSENYTSKLAQEIQSMHFGASKKQITLHTGVLHIGAGGKPLTFCSLSDDCDHGPFGIWTHLRPILEDIKKEHPAVNIIHFFSDGPCTQYRQKLNFLLFSNDLANRGIQLGKRIWFTCDYIMQLDRYCIAGVTHNWHNLIIYVKLLLA